MLDARRLLTFREVAHRGSFSRAGEALALTQPAVSQQVAGLERALGLRLLDRGPGGPVPTEAGALALAHADAVAERLALAGEQLAELAAAERGAVRVGAFASSLASLVPSAVARLTAEWPDAEVEVTESGSEALGGAVASGRLHLGVCFQDAAAPPVEPGGTRRHELGEEPMLALLAPGHRLAGRERVRLAELAADAWTAPSRGHLIWRACVAAGFEPRIAFVTHDPLAIRALVADGLAVTLIPRLLAGRLAGVAAVPLAPPAPRRSLYALTPSAGTRPEAIAMVEWMAAEIATIPGSPERAAPSA